MKKSRFSETQIIGILKQVEAGRQVKDVCREHGISDATYYQWKSKYGGMEAADIKRLKELEDENRKLKLMVADLTLENRAIKEVFEGKALSPADKREAVDRLMQFGISQRRACKAVGLSRTVYVYRPDRSADDEVIAVLQELAERFPERGFGKYFKLIRRRGHEWNHKRVYRIYCALNLNRRRAGKKRLPPRTPAPLAVPEGMNRSWSMDFMSDALWCGRRFRTFNVVDDFNREILAIEVDLNLPAARVIRVLERIAAWRGYPAKLRMDNGPEFIAVALADWAEQHHVELEFIQPGRPMQNGFIERFNRSYREGVLSMYVFRTLEEVRERTEAWMKDYNEELPHDALGDLTPVEYRVFHHPETSSNGWH
ncbi:MAG: IS3 family transposase [Methylobacterium sp.]|nr:IS3 family transposase [Methylobacterium sp.]